VLLHSDVVVRGVPRRTKRLHELYEEVCGGLSVQERSAILSEQLQLLSLSNSSSSIANPAHQQQLQILQPIPAQSSNEDGLVLADFPIRDLRSLSALLAREEARQQFPACWHFVNLRFEQQHLLSQESQHVETGKVF
jgi:hypothetical protein